MSNTTRVHRTSRPAGVSPAYQFRYLVLSVSPRQPVGSDKEQAFILSGRNYNMVALLKDPQTTVPPSTPRKETD